MKKWAITISLVLLCILAYAQFNSNDCQNYYYKHTANDTAHYKFKKCVVKGYYSYDSLFAKKRYTYTYTSYFNNDGNRLSSVTLDSNKAITDSTRYRYNANGNLIFHAEYQTDDSGVMKRTICNIITRDARGNPLKDSETNRGYGKIPYYIHTTYEKFDAHNNVTEAMEVKNNQYDEDDDSFDTTKTFSRYDTMDNEIYNKNISNDDTTVSYTTYDTNDLEVFTAEVFRGDSTYTTTKYTEKGKPLEVKEYDEKNLTKSYTYDYAKNGNSTETYELLSTADVFSCPNNIIEVTVKDSNDNVLSEVETKEKDGQPMVTTTIHKYVFEHGQIKSDTETTIEKGFMYAEEKVWIEQRQFDANGNMVDSKEIGGNYNSNSHEGWKYNEFNKQLYHISYSSCDTDLPTYETVNTWYPDGKSIKQERSKNYAIKPNDSRHYYDYSSNETINYDKNARKTTLVREGRQETQDDGTKCTIYRLFTYEYK